MPLPPNTSLREPQAGDETAIARLLGQFGYPTDPEALAVRLARITADSATRMLVADASGAVIGVGAVHFIDILESDSSLAVLIALAVDDAHQGQGGGTSLVRALVGEA